MPLMADYSFAAVKDSPAFNGAYLDAHRGQFLSAWGRALVACPRPFVTGFLVHTANLWRFDADPVGTDGQSRFISVVSNHPADRDELILGDLRLTLSEEDGLISYEAIRGSRYRSDHRCIGAVSRTLGELCILCTEGIELILESIDVSLIKRLYSLEALLTETESDTCLCRYTEGIGVVRAVVVAHIQTTVASFSLEEEIYTWCDVEVQLETSVSRHVVRVGELRIRMIELVLIAYTDEGDEVEDTALLVAGEVVHYIEEEVIVTTDEVVLVT